MNPLYPKPDTFSIFGWSNYRIFWYSVWILESYSIGARKFGIILIAKVKLDFCISRQKKTFSPSWLTIRNLLSKTRGADCNEHYGKLSLVHASSFFVLLRYCSSSKLVTDLHIWSLDPFVIVNSGFRSYWGFRSCFAGFTVKVCCFGVLEEGEDGKEEENLLRVRVGRHVE